MIEILASVDGPGFYAGIVLQNDRVVEAAPRVRRELKGKTRDQVRDICREKGWLVRVVELRRR